MVYKGVYTVYKGVYTIYKGVYTVSTRSTKVSTRYTKVSTVYKGVYTVYKGVYTVYKGWWFGLAVISDVYPYSLMTQLHHHQNWGKKKLSFDTSGEAKIHVKCC